MKAFEVLINGHHLCLIGIGESGVLNAIVTWVGRKGSVDDLFLDVGGLNSATDEHVRWPAPTIGVGTEVTIRVVESDTVDPPSERYRDNERPSEIGDESHEN